MTMNKKVKVAELPTFDMAEYLSDDEALAQYLSIVLAENDPAELAEALNTVARARGMSEIAERAGLTREALYKALRRGSKPRFDTIQRVCAALGLRFSVTVGT
jgi:probable addiction module antidote protein